jgi:hypothetical protein
VTSFLYLALGVVVGIAIGRLYQWFKGELVAQSIMGTDPATNVHNAVADIAATRRRAEEQVRRFHQPSGDPTH